MPEIKMTAEEFNSFAEASESLKIKGAQSPIRATGTVIVSWGDSLDSRGVGEIDLKNKTAMCGDGKVRPIEITPAPEGGYSIKK